MVHFGSNLQHKAEAALDPVFAQTEQRSRKVDAQGEGEKTVLEHLTGTFTAEN